VLRELCATQDEKYKERIAQVEQECVTLRGHVEHLQSLIKESEDCKTKLNKKVTEKAQAQKQMRYRLLFRCNNITSRHQTARLVLYMLWSSSVCIGL
jgi:chromosome segregation ATPase